MEISVIIPIYNEAENIEPLYRSLRNVLGDLNKDHEIIFVNDGSSDNSLNILTGLRSKDKNLRIISHDVNHGQSAAMGSGFKNARGKIIITIDGDNQNDPDDIPKMLEMLNDYDTVVGWRHIRKDSFSKRIVSRFANYVRNRVTRDDIIDIGCTLKVFRRKALENITIYKGMHRFLPTLIKMEGFKVGQMKVNHRERLHGTTKYSAGNRMVKPFIDLLAVRWMQKNLPIGKSKEIQ